MPSLVSSSEGSPIAGSSSTKSEPTKALTVKGVRSIPVPSTAERAAVNALQSSEKTAVNALLMAAMAMTEMSGHKHKYEAINDENRQDASIRNADISGEDAIPTNEAYTPPLKNSQNDSNHCGNDNNGSPDATIRVDDKFETPQRNLLKKFMSPKRKSSETKAEEGASSTASNLSCTESKLSSNDLGCEDDDDESPKREHPGDGTPSIGQKVKRSRLGSLKKGVRLLDMENPNEKKSMNGGIPMELTTPAKGKEGNIADLTPVSARCIDFKKMRVNDSSSDPAVVDPASTSC